MGVAALVYVLVRGLPFTLFSQMMTVSVNSFTLIAIPLFILAAHILNEGGVTDRILEACRAFVGHLRGGLAHVNVLNSVIFAGMSGSALADASGIGLLEIKVMEKEGYTTEFSAATTAASATIGPIIPPSIPMLLYASLTDTSVGRLFAGGILPGLLMALALMIYIALVAKRMNLPQGKFPGLKGVAKALWTGMGPLLAPVILLGGMFSGVFTPTEAAAVTVLYALLLVGPIYGSLRLSDLPQMMVKTGETTGVVLFVLATGSILSYALTSEKVGMALVEACSGIIGNPVVLLLVLNLAFLILGCVMEGASVLVIFVPMLIPLLRAAGINLVHFGVVLVLNLMIGLLTPPVGLILYLMTNLAGVTLEGLLHDLAPMIVALIVVLLTITVFPDLVLWMPNMIFGRP
jgi:tripartite ATP-independent transporter DctM subunit